MTAAVTNAATEFHRIADPLGAAAAARHTSAAFFSDRRLGALRRFNRALCRVAPAAAAVWARRLIATPPRFAERAWETDLRRGAARSLVTVGKRDLPVLSWGRGATVLLVHSWGGRATQLGRFVDPLVEAGFRVVAFDLPAHGEGSSGETDMIDCAAAVARVIALQAEQGHALHGIVAHSFGVMATLLAAREHGIAIPRLVSIGAFESCRWFIDAAQTQLGLSEDVGQRLRDNFEARHGHRVEFDRLSVVEMLRQSRARTLVIHDRYDREIPYLHSYALRSAGKQIEAFPTVGLGHRRILADAAVIARSAHFLSAR
ncbi:MAG: alpha/beta fold hydrolase [Burkholderiales bacterium]|nr:alpha/beta fold hydrolase [Burkholderiales bacterium]